MDKSTALRQTLARGVIIFAIACVVVWGLEIGFNWINPMSTMWVSLAYLLQFLLYAVPTITGVLIAAVIVVTIWQRTTTDPR